MADRSSGSLPESDRVLGHCVTRVTSHSFSFSWEIEDFLSLPPSLGNEVYSSYFSVPEMEGTWFLCLCPRGSEFDPEDTVSVWLYWCGKSKVEVQFTIAFCTDSKGMNVLASETGTYEFGLMENCSGWSAFIGRQDLKDALRSDQAILPLYIHCHLRCFDGVVTDTATTDAVRSIDHEYMHELGQALHADSSGCDVVLLVQGTRIPAHRIVLMARSPVFRAMFGHDLAEHHSGQVEIQDYSVAAVREMKRFIYTGQAEHLPDVGAELLELAVVYDLPRLKAVCASALPLLLSESNVCRILHLAHLHSLHKLKHSAVRFILRHPSVLALPAWKECVVADPDLVTALFTSLKPV